MHNENNIMAYREELIQLSGQIINGIMSADNSIMTKLVDRTLHEETAKNTVELAHKILKEGTIYLLTQKINNK